MADLLTVAEVCARLRCGRSRVFELLALGVLRRGARYGRATVITSESVDEAMTAAPPEAVISRKRVRSKKVFATDIDAVLAEARAS